MGQNKKRQLEELQLLLGGGGGMQDTLQEKEGNGLSTSTCRGNGKYAMEGANAACKDIVG